MNLWWARIRVDPRNSEARRDLRDVVDLHRRVMKLMPDNIGEQPRQRIGVLFRLDQTNVGTTIFVQSRCQPDLSRLPAGYGAAEVRDAAPMLKALKTGLLVHYRLAANASKRQAVFVNPGRPGPVIPLYGEAAEQWWQQRADGHGLHIVSSRIQTLNPARGRADQSSKHIRHSLTRFDGIATIADAVRVREAIENGIGRGKAYGCGLLSLATVRAD